MKHFNTPFVSRKSHFALTEKLERQLRDLTQKLETAERNLAEFRAAQNGECVRSEKCKTCKHCIPVTNYYFGGSYETTVCALTLPQCKNYEGNTSK